MDEKRGGEPSYSEALPGEGDTPYDHAIYILRERIKRTTKGIPRIEEDLVAAVTKVDNLTAGLTATRREIQDLEDSEAQLITARMEHLGQYHKPEGEWSAEPGTIVASTDDGRIGTYEGGQPIYPPDHPLHVHDDCCK